MGKDGGDDGGAGRDGERDGDGIIRKNTPQNRLIYPFPPPPKQKIHSRLSHRFANELFYFGAHT